jgi:hypothetical protein
MDAIALGAMRADPARAPVKRRERRDEAAAHGTVPLMIVPRSAAAA